MMPWEPYHVDGGHPWNLALAAHLLRRAGFGASWAELERTLAEGPRRAVDRLLAPPADFEAFDRRMNELGMALELAESGGSRDSSELWLYRMIHTPYPLLEKMTLFWHDFFAVPGARLGKGSLIERRLHTLRSHALGRFDQLPGDVTRDPSAARRVVRRAYRWLVAETHEPDEALLAPLVEAFASGYDVAGLAGTMLRSNHFFSPSSYRQRVKSPVEYALGIAAALDVPLAPAALHPQLAALGQDLLEPPTRGGWAGGRRWLNRFTLVARRNLAETLVAGAKVKTRLPELLLQQEVAGAAGALDLITMPEFQLC
jgi:uncharacterized protein (DUF1800 family)